VLIRTGEPPVYTPPSNFKIKIIQVPRKWRYRWIGATGEVEDSSSPWNPFDEDDNPTGYNYSDEWDRVFRYDGLQVQLQNPNGTAITTHPLAPGGIINNSALTFIIGKKTVQNGYVLPDLFYGLIEVTVKFTDPNSAVSDEDYFYILVSGHHTGLSSNDTILFDYASPTYLTDASIVNAYDSNSINSAVDYPAANNRLTIIRLTNPPPPTPTPTPYHGINIPEIAISLSPNPNSVSRLYIIVAGAQNIILGRQSSNSEIKVRGGRSGLAAFYFGPWLFDGLFRSPPSLNSNPATPLVRATYPYAINTAGAATNAFPNSYDNKMITEGDVVSSINPGGGIYNVIVGEGMDVHYPHQLH